MHSSSCGQKNTDGWNLDQGLAAQYAAQAGLDPDLAADAGEEVWDVLKSLRDATGETDPKRQAKLVKRTKARLSKANLSRYGELVQHIEARLLALQGRGGDTELAHLTPGEVIVPPQLQTPEVVQAIQQAAQNAGIDMARYTAGSQASSVNPETGMAEFFVECADEGGCRQDPVGYGGSNIYDYDGTTYVHVTGPGQSGGHDVYSGDNWAGRPGGIGGGGGDAEYGTPGNPVSDPPDGIETVPADQPTNRRPSRPWDIDGLTQVAGSLWPDWAKLPEAFDPHYGEPDLAPPRVLFDELPEDFGQISDDALVTRIRRLQGEIGLINGGVLGKRLRIPFGGRAVELQRILDSHIAECGSRASCNPDAWRDLLPEND